MVKYVKTLQVAPADLEPFPGNAKLHDDAELDRSVERFDGQFRSVLARRVNDGRLQLLAGHGTTEALNRAKLAKVRVEVIECDDDTALDIVLADNRIGSLAGYDDAALAELLGRVDESKGFAGVGWTAGEYDDLMARLAEAAETPLPQTDPAGDSSEDNTWKTATMDDLADRYDSKGTRTVSFDYTYPVFVWLAEHLAILRGQRGIDSNAELFVALVEEVTGTEAPAELDDPAGTDAEEPEDASSAPETDLVDPRASEPFEDARAREHTYPTAGGGRFA